MAHQSLYRRYRPQSFDDVVGQEHIVRTLRNAVSDGTVAHAYLFTGPRGTGKTTTARLLAKSLDCESGPTTEPDQTCESCVEISEGTHPDVHELDAASRTGVDAVREEIITKVQYAPTRGPYRIYIIDEVHMLSTSAFNALLKTLEEPPEHTIFVLCTTHPHKVPETIHSRCQRFDFHRISVDDIVAQLERIAHEEDYDAAPGVMTLIARYAAGGLRDAISTLEQLAVYTNGRIGIEDVEGLLGEIDTELLFEIADLVAERDVAGAFRFVASRADVGTDMSEFSRGLVGHFRDLYVCAAAEDVAEVVDYDDEHLARLRSQADAFGLERLARSLDLLGDLLNEVRWSSDPRLALEVTLTRMASPRGELTVEALAERIDALESGAIARPAVSGTAGSGRSPSASAPTGEAEAGERASASDTETPSTAGDPDAPAAVRQEPATASPEADDVPDPETAVSASERTHGTSGELDRAMVKRAWPAVVAEVRKSSASKSHLFQNTEVDVDGDTLVVEFPVEAKVAMGIAAKSDTMQELRRGLGEVLGSRPPIRFQLGRGAVRPAVPDEAGAVDEGESAFAASASDEAAELGPEADPDDPPDPRPAGELEKMLIDDLGAEVVVEHPPVDDDGGTETA
jgi:DNA polymerase-3 subunit gamma/tau